jgi:hypothetical protein
MKRLRAKNPILFENTKSIINPSPRPGMDDFHPNYNSGGSQMRVSHGVFSMKNGGAMVSSMKNNYEE